MIRRKFVIQEENANFDTDAPDKALGPDGAGMINDKADKTKN